MLRRSILNALRARYEAEIAEADATANIYLDNSVGIGEHPQHLEEMDKLIDTMASSQDKLDILNAHFSQYNPSLPKSEIRRASP